MRGIEKFLKGKFDKQELLIRILIKFDLINCTKNNRNL